MPSQYDYSNIAGGYTSTCPNGIKEAFAYVDAAGLPQLNCTVNAGSSHFLEDFQTFLASKSSTWNFSSTAGNNNPCSGCHNPHRAQRDPHTTGSRGWPVSRPSEHTTDNNAWGLWGDESGERMSAYTGSYQAPYRFGGTTYEPDGSLTTDGSNLTDYVTFCTDCHNSTNTISSTPLGRNLRTINWNTEKHGMGDGDAVLASPYSSGPNYVLSCTDCHEPHGAPNSYLTRKEINNGLVTITGNDMQNNSTEWATFCERCHPYPELAETHHTSPVGADCMLCHLVHGPMYNPCYDCHYHGSTFTGTGYTNYPIF
jgi:hypothetical protein